MTLRLVIPSREEVDAELGVVRPWWQFSVRFNVAISQSVPLARMHAGESEGVMMRWGLVERSPAGGVSFTTCGIVPGDRLQTAQELRTPWLHGQRGIVPVAGFYLWHRIPGGHHQPYYVRLVNRPVFGLAALWERAEASDGEVTEGCALIEVEANPLLAEIASSTGQMPVILDRKDYDAWLSATAPQARMLLLPYPHTRMVCHPVGPYVNHLEFDAPGLIKPAAGP